ncbi:MAG TPA: cadmium resistance transporter, partial [Stenomitos sp.]
TDIQTVSQPSPIAKGTPALLKSLLSPRTYQVAAVTLANGGDNIGIYVPLFANSTRFELGIMLGVFMAMIALWCFIAQYLARHPWFARPLTRYGHRIVPFVLVGLGIFIFVESGTYESLRGL